MFVIILLYSTVITGTGVTVRLKMEWSCGFGGWWNRRWIALASGLIKFVDWHALVTTEFGSMRGRNYWSFAQNTRFQETRSNLPTAQISNSLKIRWTVYNRFSRWCDLLRLSGLIPDARLISSFIDLDILYELFRIIRWYQNRCLAIQLIV